MKCYDIINLNGWYELRISDIVLTRCIYLNLEITKITYLSNNAYPMGSIQ